MTKKTQGAALAAVFFAGLGAGSPTLAQTGTAPTAQTSEATIETERLLGSGEEDARFGALLPFTRSLGASGWVVGSLARAAAAAGVPRAAMVEALRALDSAADRRVPLDGDAFFIRWQQTYAVEGAPIGVGRVLWLELRTTDGTIALHRFRPCEGAEQFFLTDGQATPPPVLALPIEDVTVTSRFGLRIDPFARIAATGAAATGASAPAAGAAASGMGGPLADPPAGLRQAKRSSATARPAHRLFSGFAPRRFMHEGIDFALPQGTPIYAASDGVVAGARPNGGYGNWVRIDHEGGVATAYGHLSRFAPGLKQGARIARGELVGFSGNTGHSTGPHLHFEVLTDGKPVDPLLHAAVAQLGGADLDRFAKQVAAEQRERESEAASAGASATTATAF